MRIRSPRLLALSVVLLCTGGTLGALLQHDGRAGGPDVFATADEGDSIVVQSRLEGLDRGDWARLDDGLPFANHTYTLDEQPGLWAIATSPVPLPVDDPVVVRGTVVHEGALPDGTMVVLMHVERSGEPLVFR